MSLIVAQVHKDHALLVTDTRACIDRQATRYQMGVE